MTNPHIGILPLGGELMDLLRQGRDFNTLDRYLAGFLMQEASRPVKELALAVALTSQATREGHVCLDLSGIAGRSLGNPAEEPLLTPPLEAWCQVLRESGVVGQPGDDMPLILDPRNRLYLHRYWDYEQRLAEGLLRRAQQSPGQLDRSRLKTDLERLFPPSSSGLPDDQKIAAATAVLKPFTVISGGPGTGKTTTVVRLLALLRQQLGGKRLRIALTAPTGMAAARLQQAIRLAKTRLPLDREQLQDLPETATTLHRLLGVKSQGSGFRYHKHHPLPLDLLILDEASMVDVALMAKLMDALPDSARLILLGDHHQLASVEAGAVLGDLCEGCEGPGGGFAQVLESLTGQPIPSADSPRNRLSDHVVVLRQSYRFSDASGVGQLARAVNSGSTDEACRQFATGPGRDDLNWLPGPAQAVEQSVRHFSELAEMIRSAEPVPKLFDKLYEFRLLCALRSGPRGVDQVNQSITRRLVQSGQIAAQQEWYPGRPVMMTRNDYTLNLYNGETGLVLPDPQQPDRLSVVFSDADQGLRWINPSRLPHCDTVYALTVHKSQGSEYAHVLLQLPDRDSPVLCRELLYTAITRAKTRFSIVGPEAVFRTAVSRQMQRTSGLQDRLQE
ncbi:MAG: exodeoxyribonuclease V subunit alpha [Candidatus Thiodiazotropha sp.]